MAVAIIDTSSGVATQIGTFGDLKTAVTSAMGRDDIPDHIYDLATAHLNSKLRLREMMATTTRTAAEDVTLPDDFREAVTVTVEYSGVKKKLSGVGQDALNIAYDESGLPSFYAVDGPTMTLMPVPDSDYDMEIIYYAQLPSLSLDEDTNVVLTTYPGLYYYMCLYHAAVWAKDGQSAAGYYSAYELAETEARRGDVRSRRSGPLYKRRVRRL